MPVRLEHGTPEGYTAGCTNDADCPAFRVHGMSCQTAHYRNASGEHRYLRARARGLTSTQIARELGFTAPLPDLHAAARDAADERLHIETTEERRDRIARAAATRPALTRPTPKETPAMNTPTPAEVAKTTKPLTVQPVPDIDVDELENAAPAPKPPRKKPAPLQLSLATFTNGLSQRATREKGAEIREWCRNNGYAGLGDRGTIPQDALAAYATAHPSTDAHDVEVITPAAIAKAMDVPIEVLDHVEQIETELTELLPPAEDEAMGHPDDYPIHAKLLQPTSAAYAEIVDRKFATEEIAQALEDTRARVDAPARPEWATVAISEDVEKARNLAARLEQENAHLTEQLTTAHNALALALTKRDRDRQAHDLERIRLLAVAESRRTHVDELEQALELVTTQRDEAGRAEGAAYRRAAAAHEELDRLRTRIENAALTPRRPWRRKARA